jgi:hypothetical protein
LAKTSDYSSSVPSLRIFGKTRDRNDAAVPTLGRIELRRVTTAADARAETEPPHGYGAYVLHGAFTLWNMPP